MSDYMPKLWVRPSNYIGQTWDGWLVFLGRNRDSGLLTDHNFETARDLLSALDCDHPTEDTRTVLTVSENHWACGWVEWIAIHPSNKAAVDLAEDLARNLDQYPILDEDKFSEREYDAACEAWRSLSVRDRYELIKRVGNCSVFAARHNSPPDDTGVEETLRGWL